MAAQNSNESKLKTYTSTRKSTFTLVTLQSFSISGEISAEKCRFKIEKFRDVCMIGGMHYTPSHTNVCKFLNFQLAFLTQFCVTNKWCITWFSLQCVWTTPENGETVETSDRLVSVRSTIQVQFGHLWSCNSETDPGPNTGFWSKGIVPTQPEKEVHSYKQTAGVFIGKLCHPLEVCFIS